MKIKHIILLLSCIMPANIQADISMGKHNYKQVEKAIGKGRTYQRGDHVIKSVHNVSNQVKWIILYKNGMVDDIKIWGASPKSTITKLLSKNAHMGFGKPNKTHYTGKVNGEDRVSIEYTSADKKYRFRYTYNKHTQTIGYIELEPIK